jgi:Ice-binding-like
MTHFQVTNMPPSNPFKMGSALLLASLAVGCGSSDAASSTDGGAGGNPADGAGTGDSGNASDGQGSVDVGTGAITTSAQGVNLGMAGTYVILAETAISTVPTSAVTGNLGISPAAATYITGFALTADPSNVFSTSAQVTGSVYAATYAQPTPSNLTTAIGDMQVAFTDAAGRAPSVTELGAGSIGGMTLAPGVYRWGTGLLIPTDITLAGNGTDVWIFQIAENLTVSDAARIVLSGGALPENVFWQVSGSTDIGTTAQFQGVLLSMTSVAVHTGASIHGRMLAQAAVNIQGSAVVEP